MHLVAGVDSLGRVTQLPLLLVLQARQLLDDGNAELLRQTGIDSGFKNDVVALADHLAHHFRSALHGTHVRRAVLVHGGGDGHDIEVRGADLLKIVRQGEIAALERLHESLAADFAGGILTVQVRLDLRLAHIETDHLHSLLGKSNSHRHTHITQTDNTNLEILRVHFPLG